MLVKLYCSPPFKILCSTSFHSQIARGRANELTLEQKLAIYLFLKTHTINGVLLSGAICDAAKEFAVNRKTVNGVRTATKDVNDLEQVLNCLWSKTSFRGRTGYSPEDLRLAIQPVPMNRRRKYRRFAHSCNIPPFVLH